MSVASESETSVPQDAKFLGKGAYGIVYEGTWNGKKVAIKRIDKIEFSDSNSSAADPTNAQRQREEDNMKNLDHSNVLTLLHVEIDKHFKYFYLELCEGTIGDYIRRNYTGPMPPPEADSLYQMAAGLAYIHSKGLVHRDIKDDNILIYKSPTEGETWLKISDFGFSKPTTASGSYSMKSGVKGTRLYLSPELLMLELEQENDGIKPHQKSNRSSDIFALGCVFFSYLNKGKHPFEDFRGFFHIPVNVMEGKYNVKGITDPLFQHIVEGMIAADPLKRLGLDAVKLKLKPRLTEVYQEAENIEN
ncbi:serine/threonine-protein kinase/endoribonuclease ire-1-like [Daphnia carinata]|uniref:serine/threonine-protein kinase/endoribonuclease ire-1-like n=1 Tax=Daphnia carinata TaxID=120202 RepID=UPI00257E3E3B|nr:serine/threonine-protein kinase/endoribonuclease ire-1-like [Daphnia carinata]